MPVEDLIELAHLVTGYIGAGLLGFLAAYLRKRGERRAVMETAARLTRLEEAVRAEFQMARDERRQRHESDLKALELKHQLRMAALDRRLDAHQQAYARWWRLLGVVFDEDKIGPEAAACQEWWVENSLYLSGEARRAFASAYHAALDHKELVNAHRAGAPVSSQMIKDNWKTISGVGAVLVRETALPELGDLEIRPPTDGADEP